MAINQSQHQDWYWLLVNHCSLSHFWSGEGGMSRPRWVSWVDVSRAGVCDRQQRRRCCAVSSSPAFGVRAHQRLLSSNTVKIAGQKRAVARQQLGDSDALAFVSSGTADWCLLWVRWAWNSSLITACCHHREMWYGRTTHRDITSHLSQWLTTSHTVYTRQLAAYLIIDRCHCINEWYLVSTAYK